MQIDLIAFDADDTLWENEVLYRNAQDQFKELLSRYHSRDWVEENLYQTEMKNLEHFGYGIKAFVLSMIETAIELTEGRITGSEIGQIIQLGRNMLGAEITLLEHVKETVASLASSYSLMVITKGDLLDQQNKMKRSGLDRFFRSVEVVSHKTVESYANLLARHSVIPHNFVMVGNSLKSDILPVIELGGIAVYVPHALTWAHENDVDLGDRRNGFFEIPHLGLLPDLLEWMQGRK